MVDLEGTALLGEIAIDLYISVEPTGKSGNAAGKNSRPAAHVIGVDRGSEIGALRIKSGGPGSALRKDPGTGTVDGCADPMYADIAETEDSSPRRTRSGAVDATAVYCRVLAVDCVSGGAPALREYAIASDTGAPDSGIAGALSNHPGAGATDPTDCDAASGRSVCVNRIGVDGSRREAPAPVTLDDGVALTRACGGSNPAQHESATAGDGRAAHLEIRTGRTEADTFDGSGKGKCLPRGKCDLTVARKSQSGFRWSRRTAAEQQIHGRAGTGGVVAGRLRLPAEILIYRCGRTAVEH